MEEIRKDATKEKTIKIALKILKYNIALEKVAEYSGLFLDDVKRLRLETICRT